MSKIIQSYSKDTCSIVLVEGGVIPYFVGVIDTRYSQTDIGSHYFSFNDILNAVSFYNIILDDMLHTNRTKRKGSFVLYVGLKYYIKYKNNK